MDLSWLSLAALVVVIGVSCTTRANPGVLAIVLAWLIAVYAAPAFGQSLGMGALAEAFPSQLFLTLLGVCLLFAGAEANGTLARIAATTERLCRGNLGLIALAFLVVSWLLGTVGPGNIAVAGLVAPLAMATAERTGIPPLPMAILVGHGAIASTLSPLTASGVVADQILAGMGLGGHEWRVYTANALANIVVALAGFLVLGGWRLLARWHVDDEIASRDSNSAPTAGPRSLEWKHRVTLAVIAALVTVVVLGKAQVGMAAFAAALALILLGVIGEREAIRRVPWSVLLMVSGVGTLAALMEKTGGIQRFAEVVNMVSNEHTVTAVLAFVTGIVSIFSSTTGVVLPAFLPMVRTLAAIQPQSNPLHLALSVIIGGNLVDVSPLSTIGALCLAACSAHVDRRKLFNQLLLWGFVLAVVAALLCWTCLTVLGL